MAGIVIFNPGMDRLGQAIRFSRLRSIENPEFPRVGGPSPNPYGVRGGITEHWPVG